MGPDDGGRQPSDEGASKEEESTNDGKRKKHRSEALLGHIYVGRGRRKGPESGGCGNSVTRGSIIVFVADDEGGGERRRGSHR